MPSRLRILMAVQYYLPHRSGLTLYVQRVAEGLARRGHRVTVLTSRFDRGLAHRERVGGVDVVRLWAPLRISRGQVMPTLPWQAARLVARSDVVCLHTPMPETPIFAALAPWLRRGLVVAHHGDLRLPRRGANRLIEAVNLTLHGTAARAAQRLIAYSHDYADHSTYLRPWRARTAVVYPPIEIPRPRPERVAALRRAWCEREGSRLIGYCGRFVEEKRPDLLIRALARIREHHPGTRIVFAGAFRLPYERFYERSRRSIEEAGAQLRFLGPLGDPAELADFYAACDVLALPSDSDCLGLVQVEAMRCGTPVVATDIPGAREAVRVTGMGEIVAPGDPDALADAVCRVLADPARYRRPLSEIEAAFDLEQTLVRYERHLREAAEQGRGGRPRA